MQKHAHTFDDYGNFMVQLTLQICSSAYLGPGPPGFKLVHPLAGGTSGRMRFAFQFSTGYQHGPTHTTGRL